MSDPATLTILGHAYREVAEPRDLGARRACDACAFASDIYGCGAADIASREAFGRFETCVTRHTIYVKEAENG